MFHTIAALAEFERALISDRTKAGLAAARHRGRKLGCPRALSSLDIEDAKRLIKTQREIFVAKQLGAHVKTLRSTHQEKTNTFVLI